MKLKTVAVPPEVMEVLNRSTITAEGVTLPPGQLSNRQNWEQTKLRTKCFMTKTQFVCKMAAVSRHQVAVKAWPAPKVSEVLTPATNYNQFGRRSELWAAVQDEVSRQNTIARGRELRHWREYGTYGDRVTVLALAIRQSAKRKAKAAELAGERRKCERLGCYHAAAKDRIASAVDAASCEAAIDGEMQALKNALVYNTYGDYEGWLHGVPLGRMEGARYAHGIQVVTMDGWSGSAKWSSPIKHKHTITSDTLDALRKRLKKFTAPTEKVWSWRSLSPAVREACRGWRAGRMCRRCDGDGLVERRERTVQCPACGGAAELAPKKVYDEASLTAAIAAAKDGQDESAQIAAAVAAATLPRDFVDPAEAVREAAMNLGLRRDSTLAVAVHLGRVSESEADRIAEKTIHRHHHTNYDALLAAGMSREDARANMQGDDGL